MNLAGQHDTWWRLVENAPFGVVLVDATLRVQQMNAAAQKVFCGNKSSPWIEREVGELLQSTWAEADVENLSERFREVLTTGEAYANPSLTVTGRSSGATQRYDWRLEPIALPDDAMGVACYFSPLTTQRPANPEAQANEKSDETFRTLFESIDEGFCTVEMIFNSEGTPVDYRFQQANRVFEAYTGLKDVIGRTALELVPNLEHYWIETYGKVAITGQPLRFELESKPMNRWFNVYASRIGGPGSARLAIVFSDSTDRKTAELELIRLRTESEMQRRLYETVLSNTPDLIYVWGLDHNFQYANESLLRMWGKTKEEAFGKHCLQLGYEPWHAAMHDREIDQVAATKRPLRGEVPFNGAYGLRDYDYILVPVMDSAGEVVAVAGTTRDITDRNRSEEAVRLRTAQFETLLNQAPIGVYLVNDEFRLSEINPTARRVFSGIDNLIGRDFEETMHILWQKEIAAEVVALFRRTLESGEPFEAAEFAVQRLENGQAEFYSWRIDRITLPNARLGVVCYFVDISAQVKARERIAQSEERFRTLASVIADVLWTADANGAFVAHQPAWQDFTGQTWQEQQGYGWMNAVRDEDRQVFATHWQEACSAGTLFEAPGRLWHAATKRWRHFVARAIPLRDKEGIVREWVGACTDVDEQKRTEGELRLARDQAERVSRAKDHFLAVLSHELRTPLTPVLMGVAALEHDPELSLPVREDLAMMKRNIELETKLIDDLLDLSRITTGKLVLKTETVDLQRAVSHVCGICQPQARERSVRLQYDGKAHDALYVSADAARLQQVLWNVVRNGIKFTPEGGTVEVTMGKLSDSLAEVRVRDTGIGISPKVLPTIFDAFEQGGEEVTRQFGGLGLGLAICASVMALSGGSIRAESEGEGKGSTFVIEIPLAKAVPNAPTTSDASHEENGQERLLLVEDHTDTLRMLSRILRKQGYHVVPASNVSSALAAVESNHFDLIVSDLGLPDGDGYELMRRIQAIKRVPGIAMSGFGMEEDMRRSRQAGFSEHLVKPIDINKLVAAIQRVMENASALTSD